jgi:hypothetical protein
MVSTRWSQQEGWRGATGKEKEDETEDELGTAGDKIF